MVTVMRVTVFLSTILVAISGTVVAQPSDDRVEVIKINDSIYEAVGASNVFLVKTPAGNVIIDTTNPVFAKEYVSALKKVSNAPVRYIILTHGHWDHTGGVAQWREPGTHVIAQREQVEFLNYSQRLNNFYAVRNTAQFGHEYPLDEKWAGNFGAAQFADIFFDQKYEFTLGGLKFQLFSTPGETPDHLTVWIPRFKAAFIGDNYDESFPALYTLRGTKPRPALDYIASLKLVMSLKPDVVLLGHGDPIRGNGEITRMLTHYADATQYVHDEVVKGMNAGKDVHTLMNEIHLPPALATPEMAGKVSWSVRGIYEGYAGWFDMKPETMYETPVTAVYADLVRLAGGPEGITKLALDRIQNGKAVEALHLTSIALAADPQNRGALEARLKALELLKSASSNHPEMGWLDYFMRDANEKLAGKPR
jgi:alkyl sulfatase BDS1-like metallo-beta-lactamase superfamily hydrolase